MRSEQTKKRNQNRYDILRAIQSRGPLRRSDIARACGIRKSSITGLVDEMINQEVICNDKPERPRSPLVFTVGKWHTVAANVAEGEISFARVDLSGSVTDRFTVSITDDSYETIQKILVDGIEKLLKIMPDRNLGIGVSLTGIVDPVDGVCLCSINVPQLNGGRIKEYLSNRFAADVVVENDVRASLWAGIWFERFLAQYSNLLYLDITSGVGSSLLMNGTPHVGATFAAGELGHMCAGDEGRSCRCGKRDCLEAYCSIDAIKRDIIAVSPGLGSIKNAVDIAKEASRNVVIANVLDRAMERLSRLLSVLVAYIDPEVILLGNQDPTFYEVVTPMLKKHLLLRLQGCNSSEVDIKIVPSATDSALRGVAGLIINRAFKERFNDMDKDKR